jgi:hypothetical protein
LYATGHLDEQKHAHILAYNIYRKIKKGNLFVMSPQLEILKTLKFLNDPTIELCQFASYKIDNF